METFENDDINSNCIAFFGVRIISKGSYTMLRFRIVLILLLLKGENEVETVGCFHSSSTESGALWKGKKMSCIFVLKTKKNWKLYEYVP